MEPLLCNSPIPPLLCDRVEELLKKNEKPLFAIVSDLDINAMYKTTLMLVTDIRLLCIEESQEQPYINILVQEIKTAKVSRLYGNAVMLVNGDIILRFSFSVIGVMESAAM